MIPQALLNLMVLCLWCHSAIILLEFLPAGTSCKIDFFFAQPFNTYWSGGTKFSKSAAPWPILLQHHQRPRILRSTLALLKGSIVMTQMMWPLNWWHILSHFCDATTHLFFENTTSATTTPPASSSPCLLLIDYPRPSHPPLGGRISSSTQAGHGINRSYLQLL